MCAVSFIIIRFEVMCGCVLNERPTMSSHKFGSFGAFIYIQKIVLTSTLFHSPSSVLSNSVFPSLFGSFWIYLSLFVCLFVLLWFHCIHPCIVSYYSQLYKMNFPYFASLTHPMRSSILLIMSSFKGIHLWNARYIECVQGTHILFFMFLRIMSRAREKAR